MAKFGYIVVTNTTDTCKNNTNSGLQNTILDFKASASLQRLCIFGLIWRYTN
jgi:hypothetical protein